MADGLNAIGNLLGKVDANGALLVAISGAAGPVDSLAFSGGSSLNGATTDTLKLRATGTTDILTLTTTAVTSTVPILGPAGLVSAVTFGSSADPDTGDFFPGGSGTIRRVLNGVDKFQWDATNGNVFASDMALKWADNVSVVSSGAFDLILSREAAAVLQLGADAAGVTDQMFKGPDRITSDGVGGNLTIAGGRNRGASVGGSIIFQTSPAAGAGVTGTLATVGTWGSGGILSFGAAVVGVPALKPSGATLQAILGDGSNYTRVQAASFDATVAGGHYDLLNVIAISATAPTAAGTGMAFTVATGATSFAWSVTITTANAQSAFTLTLPTAANGWVCRAQSLTNPGSMKVEVSSRTTTTVVLTQYSQTLGTAANYADNNVITGTCVAY